MDRAFTKLGLERVIAETQVANGRSVRLLERVGMLVERRLRRFDAEQVIYGIDAARFLGKIGSAMSSEPPSSSSPSSARIRELIDEWRSALGARDLDRLVTHYDPEVVFFDAVPPYRHQGIEAYRATWERMLPYLPERLGSEIRDLSITVGGDLAAVHGMQRLIDLATGEAATCGWVRVSVVYARRQDGWKVIHEHVSVPFDPMTLQASLIREL